MIEPYYQNEWVTLYKGDNSEIMEQMESESIDLTVTSPPYDDLRTYEDSCVWNFEVFKDVAKGLLHVTKQGGCVVWVVSDMTKDGSETGTSFRQALHFKDIGFNLHDTMIYRKINPIPQNHNRYEQEFEYMFVLSKGRPKTFNALTEITKNAGKVFDWGGRSFIDKNQCRRHTDSNRQMTKYTKIKGNIFEYSIGGGNTGHPAPFPLQLAIDHIQSWSNKGDTIFDPFGGSGTTAIASMRLNRKCVLCEKVEKYCDIIVRRVEQEYKVKKSSFF